jgi:hypothetical protein
MVTFCALTIAGSIKKNRAAKRANLFISNFFGQILVLRFRPGARPGISDPKIRQWRNV